MRACHRCKAPWEEPAQPGFNNLCRCGMPLHACRNCRHFVARGPLRCMVPDVPRVLDPHAANRCSSFEFIVAAGAEAETGATFEAAFAEEPVDQRNARRRWDQLFGS
jgi:hypothetical protein